MKEYCKLCKIPLEEWEWCGRGYCEVCDEKIPINDEEPKAVVIGSGAKDEDQYWDPVELTAGEVWGEEYEQAGVFSFLVWFGVFLLVLAWLLAR